MIKKNKISVSLLFLFLAGITSGAIWYLGKRPPRQPVNVVWHFEKPLEFVEDPLPQVAKNPYKKFSKNRSPAAVDPAAMGPRFIVEDGMHKLVIKLYFVCSSWIFLRANDSPDLVNDRLCREFAAAHTAKANLIFSKSKVPAHFTYEYTLDRPAYQNMNGTFYSRAEIQARIATDNLNPSSFLTAVNNNVDNSNPYIMPALEVTNLEALLTYSPSAPYASTEGKVRLPTGIPGFLPVSCRDPKSTATIDNYRFRWGVPDTSSIDSKCGTAADMGCSLIEKRGSVPSPTGLGSVYGCVPSCHCVHLYSNSRTWALKCSGYGGWPGQHNASSGYNACGYPIKYGNETWKSNSSTIYSHSQPLRMVDEVRVFDWLEKSRNSSAYMPVYNEYKVVVAVKPFAAWALGLAPVTDIETGWVQSLYLSGGTRKGLIKSKEEFFQKYGALVLTMDSPYTSTLAHELGHLFGAMHQRESLSGTVTPEWSIEKLRARKIGAFVHPESPDTSLYKTIVANIIDASSREFFSSRSIKDGKDTLGINEDNRAQIVRTLSYLAGRNLETIKTPEERVGIFNAIKMLLIDKE